MVSDFWVGFVVGFAVAGVLGFSLQQIRLWQKKWSAMTQPQRVEVKTTKTPWQVVSTGLQVGCVVIVALILIGVIVWLVLGSPI